MVRSVVEVPVVRLVRLFLEFNARLLCRAFEIAAGAVPRVVPIAVASVVPFNTNVKRCQYHARQHKIIGRGSLLPTQEDTDSWGVA